MKDVKFSEWPAGGHAPADAAGRAGLGWGEAAGSFSANAAELHRSAARSSQL
jgi:hypothetical protein